MKFVTRRTTKNSVELQNTADDFLKTVKSLIEFGSENVFNSDQRFSIGNSFWKIIVNEGVKKVECTV